MIDRSELEYEIEILGKQIDREPNPIRQRHLCAAYAALQWAAHPGAMCPISRSLPWELPPRQRSTATLTIVRPQQVVQNPPPIDDPSIDDARCQGVDV